MELQSKPWGNNQGIRLPKTDMSKAGFRPGDTPLKRAEEEEMISCRSFQHKTLEERAAEYDGHLSLDEELDWRGDPLGKEV